MNQSHFLSGTLIRLAPVLDGWDIVETPECCIDAVKPGKLVDTPTGLRAVESVSALPYCGDIVTIGTTDGGLLVGTRYTSVWARKRLAGSWVPLFAVRPGDEVERPGCVYVQVATKKIDKYDGQVYSVSVELRQVYVNGMLVRV